MRKLPIICREESCDPFSIEVPETIYEAKVSMESMTEEDIVRGITYALIVRARNNHFRSVHKR